MFDKIKGQNRAIGILKNALSQNRVAHSYLFYGPDGVGKLTTALYFGMAINCQSDEADRPCGHCNSCKKFLAFSHPDFNFIFPFPNMPRSDISVDGEIKSDQLIEAYQDYIQNKIKAPWQEFHFTKNVGIRISSIRMLEHRINLSPNEAKKKIYIIEHAELMNRQAANAFLKTLEEPPMDTIIILTTSKLNSLLPTILSRCQKIPFNIIPRKIIEAELTKSGATEKIAAKMFARIANGSMAKAMRLAESGELADREETIELLEIVASGQDVRFIDFVQRYKSAKTQSLLKNIISNLLIWIADIAYFKLDQKEIVNLDQIELIEKLYQKNPAVEDYSGKLVEFFETMLYRLEGHVNPQLIITGVYNKLRSIF